MDNLKINAEFKYKHNRCHGNVFWDAGEIIYFAIENMNQTIINVCMAVNSMENSKVSGEVTG